MEITKHDGKCLVRDRVNGEEIAAILLKYMKEKTEEFQGQKLENAVITIPAVFTKSQKSATKEAAKLAGWKNAELLPEPIAAAFAYFINRPIPDKSTVLLFDLGGGTLDVCIFKIHNGQIKIILNTGDATLGGRDFDTALINHFKNLLISSYGISMTKSQKYKLMQECQSLDVADFDTTKEGIIQITQMEFEKMTELLLNRIQNTIQSALYNFGMKVEEIDKVLQVGGGSRMPAIKELLKNIFPNADHLCEEHPDEVVAIGAAYYAQNAFSY